MTDVSKRYYTELMNWDADSFAREINCMFDMM